MLTGPQPSQDYPIQLRRVKFYDAKNDKLLVLLTNNFDLHALTIAELYRCRWQVELFFKWIKQHLRIKAFFGTSENAVKTQVWIAIAVYVLVAILKKRLKSKASLYTILQILSLTLFEKTSLNQLVTNSKPNPDEPQMVNQLNLFEEISGQ
jgi:IS4 transposase